MNRLAATFAAIAASILITAPAQAQAVPPHRVAACKAAIADARQYMATAEIEIRRDQELSQADLKLQNDLYSLRNESPEVKAIRADHLRFEHSYNYGHLRSTAGYSEFRQSMIKSYLNRTEVACR